MKAKQRVPALRGGQPDDLASTRGLRSNFVAARLDETENRAQQPGIRGMSDKITRARGTIDAGQVYDRADVDEEGKD